MKNASVIQKAGRSVDEFCQSAGICRASAYKYMASGTIKYVKVGRRTIVTTDPADFLAGFAQVA